MHKPQDLVRLSGLEAFQIGFHASCAVLQHLTGKFASQA